MLIILTIKSIFQFYKYEYLLDIIIYSFPFSQNYYTHECISFLHNYVKLYLNLLQWTNALKSNARNCRT